MEEEMQVNPQMAAVTEAAITGAAAVAACKPPLPVKEDSSEYKISVVVYGGCYYSSIARTVAAISSPISSCRVTSLVVLTATENHDGGGDAETTSSGGRTTTAATINCDDNAAMAWLRRNHVLHAETVNIFYGENGYKEMLEETTADVVYLIRFPLEHQRRYSLDALNAQKHVLIQDPISASLEEFNEQLNCARKVDRFILFSSMFVHHHRVQSFLDHVLRLDTFGEIGSIDALLMVHYDDAAKVGVSFPLRDGRECTRQLGRYCVLLSLLMLTRAGSRPLSVKVNECARTAAGGVPHSVKGVVKFTNDRELAIRVGFSGAPTRQVIEVQSHDRRYATMTDFAIPHPDGLATYRIYDKDRDPLTGELEVVRGEALEIPTGPPVDVMMWRRFCNLCRTVVKEGWDGADSPVKERFREFTNVALQCRQILAALHESLENDFAEVSLDIQESQSIV